MKSPLNTILLKQKRTNKKAITYMTAKKQISHI